MIRLNLDRHRHLLGARKDVFVSPYGLLGGGWEFSADVRDWINENGLHAAVVEMESSEPAEVADGYITFDQYRVAIPIAIFKNQNDAFMFKMAWL